MNVGDKLFVKEVSVVGTSLRGGFLDKISRDGFFVVRFGRDALTFSYGRSNVVPVADGDKPKVPPGVYNNVLLNGFDVAGLDFDGVTVVGNLDLTGNPRLKSLKGCPPTVGKNLECIGTGITSLEHGPSVVGGNYSVGSNVSLKRLPDRVGGAFTVLRIDDHPSRILRVLDKFGKVRCTETGQIERSAGVFREKLSLVRHGFEENARL